MVHIKQRYDNVVKSVEDKRTYRGLLLNNHLKVLLISDPTTDKSSAAMDINIGEDIYRLVESLERVTWKRRFCSPKFVEIKYVMRKGPLHEFANTYSTIHTHTVLYKSIQNKLHAFKKYVIKWLRDTGRNQTKVGPIS